MVLIDIVDQEIICRRGHGEIGHGRNLWHFVLLALPPGVKGSGIHS
jgi:hypothetical protein